MQFPTGATVVHPRHGVATVTGTQTRHDTDYLELYVEAKSITIMVPVASLDEVGIRSVASKKDADAILALLEEQSDVPTAWAERNAESVSRVKSTELSQASLVIRDLTRHSQDSGKPLSAAENTMLQTCLDTVSHELSLALGLSQDDTRELILDRVGFKVSDDA